MRSMSPRPRRIPSASMMPRMMVASGAATSRVLPAEPLSREMAASREQPFGATDGFERIWPLQPEIQTTFFSISLLNAFKSGFSSSAMRSAFTLATMMSPISLLTSLKMPWVFILAVW